jgi:opacity protein-like surface antigen
MKIRKPLQGLIALAVLWFSEGAAWPRDLTKDIQLDVFALAGGSTLVDAQDWKSAGNLFHSRFEVGPKFTVGVGVPFGKLLIIETAFTAGPNNFVVTNTNLNPRVERLFPVRYYSGYMDAVVHAPFALKHFRPYAAGGVDYDRYSPSNAAVTSALDYGFGAVSTAIINHNDKFGLNLGAGLDRRLTKRLTFRIDLRDHISGSPAFGLPPAPTLDSAATYPVSGRAHNLVYTVGLLYHLGKR